MEAGILNKLSPEQLDTLLKPMIQSGPFKTLGTVCFPLPFDAYLMGLLLVMTPIYFNSKGNKQAKGWDKWPLRGFFLWMTTLCFGSTLTMWAWVLKAVSFGLLEES